MTYLKNSLFCFVRIVIWRTVLQPIVEVSEVDLVVAAEAVDVVAVEVLNYLEKQFLKKYR